jgi:NAD-dependent deacetylase
MLAEGDPPVNPTGEPALSGKLLEQLTDARHVVVLTGAGMSAESGIPTFRDAQTGLWAKYRPEELATPEAFDADPERVWQWYEERRAQVRAALPHAGHGALVALEAMVPQLSIITQNVDGLHQLSGSSRVIELHGNIMRSKCHVTHRPIGADWLADDPHRPPKSPYVSHGLARPDVVWFGEILPRQALDQALAAIESCDFCFSVGTTALVQPAASLPLMALEHGAPLVEVNPVDTPLSPHADQCFRGTAAAVLSGLVARFKSARGDLDQ